jgi:hypothetical protein
LTTLGVQPAEAQRVATLFKAHDERLVRDSAAHWLDQRELIDIARRGRAEIANVIAQDVGEAKRRANESAAAGTATKDGESSEKSSGSLTPPAA